MTALAVAGGIILFFVAWVIMVLVLVVLAALWKALRP